LQAGRPEYSPSIADRNLPIFEASRPLAGIHYQEHMSMNKDQLQGRTEEAKGTIKEVAGKLVGDGTLEAKGNLQKNLGKVQEKVGDIKQDVKKSVI
jgi:uncharacterized protein YjbJ (UPF0337 family)